MPVRTLIVDDPAFVQRRMQALLARDPAIRVVGEATLPLAGTAAVRGRG